MLYRKWNNDFHWQKFKIEQKDLMYQKLESNPKS